MEENEEKLTGEEKREKGQAPKETAAFPDEVELSFAKTALKGGMPVLKGAGFVLMLNVLFSVLGFLTQFLPENLIWLSIVLYIMFFGSMCMLLFLIGKSGAYVAVNAKTLNEVNAENNRHVPKYKKMWEFRSWKGYVIALIGSLPLIIMAFLALCFPYNQLDIKLCSPAYIGVSAVVKIVYSVFFSPFMWFNPNTHVIVALWGVLANVAAYGMGYFINGTKIQMQNDMIEDEIRRLHSDNFDVDGSDHIDV